MTLTEFQVMSKEVQRVDDLLPRLLKKKMGGGGGGGLVQDCLGDVNGHRFLGLGLNGLWVKWGGGKEGRLGGGGGQNHDFTKNLTIAGILG